MSLSLKARANKQGHGRFIWLFANIRTHQVLYSLDKYPDVYTTSIASSLNSVSDYVHRKIKC